MTHPEVLTLCQNALHTIPQDDGSPLDIHAVKYVGCLICMHPLTTGTFHKIYYLQGIVHTYQAASAYYLDGLKTKNDTV